jgi:hypothetical protein
MTQPDFSDSDGQAQAESVSPRAIEYESLRVRLSVSEPLRLSASAITGHDSALTLTPTRRHLMCTLCGLCRLVTTLCRRVTVLRSRLHSLTESVTSLAVQL